ncbi:hypothetical protein B0H16DRAFT_1717346 [Mycena metata]|uniref:Uncharacterized protein n=1 Tax=Mycena metata TaxID=1033252 RepID=A0AAD7JJE9_9AGAR|nr:hypothetical protein B0H16DRAFT_1717346 [Mycena metata]
MATSVDFGRPPLPTTMSPSPLDAQEICDYICEFLHGSLLDLRACALISTLFTSSAQRQIFHKINVAGTAAAVAAERSRRLLDIPTQSPHLIRFIRSLDIVFDEAVLTLWVDMPLTHIESLTMSGTTRNGAHFNVVTYLSIDVTSFVARLVASPTLRDFTLQRIGFDDISGLLVTSSSPTLAFFRSRPMKALKIKIMPAFYSSGSEWLAPSLCPFNFSALERLSLSGPPETLVTNLLHSIQPILHKLHIDTSMIMLSPQSDLRSLCRRHYRPAHSNWDRYSPKLENVRIDVAIFELSTTTGELLDEEPLRRLDVLLAGVDAPALRSV